MRGDSVSDTWLKFWNEAMESIWGMKQDRITPPISVEKIMLKYEIKEIKNEKLENTQNENDGSDGAFRF